eukprot:Skav201324  [mRNA]  locus=scaffold1579:33159:42172:- [translate_table: standard]
MKRRKRRKRMKRRKRRKMMKKDEEDEEGYHPAELGAAVCDALLERQQLPGREVEDVIFGCVGQVGAQGANVARTIVLSSRLLPESVPGTSVDRQCGSSQQAVHAAAQAVMSGTHDCCIAGGVEAMLDEGSFHGKDDVACAAKAGHGFPMTEAMTEKYKEKLQAKRSPGFSTVIEAFSQFGGAELLAKKYNISREALSSKEGQSEGIHSEEKT